MCCPICVYVCVCVCMQTEMARTCGCFPTVRLWVSGVCVCPCGRACSLCVRLCAYNCLPLSLRQPQAVATIGGIASNQPASFDSLMSSTCQWLPLTLIPQHAQRLSGRKPTHTHTHAHSSTHRQTSHYGSPSSYGKRLCARTIILFIPFHSARPKRQTAIQLLRL